MKAACLCRLRLIPPPRRGGLGVPARRGGSLGLQGWMSPPVARPWSAGAVPAAQGYGLGGEGALAHARGPHLPPELGRGLQRCVPAPAAGPGCGSPPPGGMGARLPPSHGSSLAVGVAAAPAMGPACQDPPGFSPPQRRGCTTLLQHLGLLSRWQGHPRGDHPTGEHHPLFSSLLGSFLQRGCSLSWAHAPRWVSPGGVHPRQPGWVLQSRAPRCTNGVRPRPCVPRAPARCQGMRPRHGARLRVAHPGGGEHTEARGRGGEGLLAALRLPGR